MRRRNRRRRDAFRSEVPESSFELELSREEIMADLEPNWPSWTPTPDDATNDSSDVAA